MLSVKLKCDMESRQILSHLVSNFEWQHQAQDSYTDIIHSYKNMRDIVVGAVTDDLGLIC